MTGIFLLVVIALWLWVCSALTQALLNHMTRSPWRVWAGLATFSALMVAPVADEIVGGIQFRALCERNAVFRMGVSNPEGRVTRFSSNPANEALQGTAITIYDTGVQYTDVNSGELVVQFHRYVAKGGLLIRVLGISEGNAPLTLGRASCSPEQARGESVHRTLRFSVSN